MVKPSLNERVIAGLHGEYSIQKGPRTAVDAKSGTTAERATAYHEMIHSELTDNSAYGNFQRLLYALSDYPDDPLSHRFAVVLRGA
jgi:hypothetical protein